ncbi:MAG: lysophospholipid acyltransferase family protein [Acidimicrobiales bacterium]
MVQRIRDWCFTVPFLIVFCLTLVVFDIAGRLARPFGLRRFEWVMAALQRTLISVFRICGTRVEVTRSEAIEPNRGYAMISNHQSMFDIVLIGGLLFTNYPKYVAKKELAKWIPSISLNLNKGGNAVIDRGNRKQAVEAIREMAETAQARNVSVVIYPEGTRSRDGQLGKFRRAGTMTMLEAADQLPVIPVTIDGSWRLLRYNLRPIPFGTTVRIDIGDPIPRTEGDSVAVSQQARQIISSNLDAWRAERS